MDFHLNHRCEACGCRAGQHQEAERGAPCPPTKAYGTAVPMRWLTKMPDAAIDLYIKTYWAESKSTFIPRS